MLNFTAGDIRFTVNSMLGDQNRVHQQEMRNNAYITQKQEEGLINWQQEIADEMKACPCEKGNSVQRSAVFAKANQTVSAAKAGVFG